MAKTQKSPETNFMLRKKIKSMLKQGLRTNEIASALGVTPWQVNNVKYGRAKIKYTPRADKGTSRTEPAAPDTTSLAPDAFAQEEEYFQHQLFVALRQLSAGKFQPDDRLRMLKDAAAIKKHIAAMSLERKINRTDAVIIAAIIRRFKPEVSDDEVIRIYTEEVEKLKVQA